MLQTSNRFELLTKEEEAPQNTKNTKVEKPPPIYLRERATNDLKSKIKEVTNGEFYITHIKRGRIEETKIQNLNIEAFRSCSEFLDKENKQYYTYQLKSSRGIKVVIRGLGYDEDPKDIREALEEKGFKAERIVNLLNYKKEKTSLYTIELEPDATKYKGRHPIFNLKSLLFTKITVEEPYRRKGLIQCHKCQEYGHSRTYCKLHEVCVICSGSHSSTECDKEKEKTESKRCANCGDNHTANYRGCVVYIELLKKLRSNSKIKTTKTYNLAHPMPTSNVKEQSQKITEGVSFADILKGPSNKNNEGIHNTLLKLNNTMQQFMANMSSNMQIMMQNLNAITQLLLQKNK